LRRELDRQVNAYLREGGQVQQIARGISGRSAEDGPLPNAPFTGGYTQENGATNEAQQKGERTYLTDVITAIEARRKPKIATKRVKHRARKKFIYDDFGEPIRWVWEE
jgi:hypothetical protein